MRTRAARAWCVLVASLLAGDAALSAAPASDAGLAELASLMTGSFASEAQARRDPDFRDVRLHMVPIWEGRDDGPWLYVEQALATKADAPYRQRVYRLARRDDGGFESRVYTLPEPLRFAGAWAKPGALAGLAPADLKLRDGCTIVLRRQSDGTFTGGTQGKGCASDLSGAAYATSEVRIDGGGLVTWDRGFDAEGKQVWGATKGGYEFLRQPSR